MRFFKNYLFVFVVIWSSCSTTKTLVEEPAVVPPTEEIYTAGEDSEMEAEEEETEHRTLDELVVTAPRHYTLPVYNPASTRLWDLIHMDLDIRMDWVNEHVIGRAEITLKPFFYDQDQVVLDAVGFDIVDITDASQNELKNEYDGRKLTISLSRAYDRDEELGLLIDYVAKPAEGPVGGGDAITSDQGFFFIDPRDEDDQKPTQIWTQGETEYNSRWFPTIDKPNESYTHKISLTVDQSFVTLSNGIKTSSREHADGTRTDVWEMRQPHAPYLTMVAAGEFAVVRERVGDLPLEYYVEPEYEPYAKQIFAHTPEMITFFSDLLDYPYPWDKYSQIITRDYVSGAMENTTAVIYGEFIQKTARELIDDSNDFIVAHELFHHWFGDLVTCESWANLTLQEGFANYSEYLWQEHKYGNDAAGFQRRSEKSGYLNSLFQTGAHPLIHYGYGDKEDMFDAHSYNKGGLVLHMLRKELGDAAFYQGLNLYLNRHKYTAVEVDELRMAFEDVSGRDLHWFFNQWYLEAGHPILEIAHQYDAQTGSLSLTVDQTQDVVSSIPIFVLPVTVSVYDQNGKETQFDITLDDRQEEVSLKYPTEPALVVFDTHDELLAVVKETKSNKTYINQYQWADQFIHRYEAIDKVKSASIANDMLIEALQDGHHSIRSIAVTHVDATDNPKVISQIEKMITSDVHSDVRGAALTKISQLQGAAAKGLLNQVFEKEQSYKVLSMALIALSEVDPESAITKAEKLKSEKTAQMTGAVGSVLAQSGDTSHLSYFEEKLTHVGFSSLFQFYNDYYSLFSVLDIDEQLVHGAKLESIATTAGENLNYKFLAATILSRLKMDLKGVDEVGYAKANEMMERVKAHETHPILSQRYKTF